MSVTLYSNRDFTSVIKDLRWGEILDYLGAPYRKGDVMMEGEIGVMRLEDAERAICPGMWATSKSWKRQGNEFPFESPKGASLANALTSAQ